MFGFAKNKKTDKRSKKPQELQASCNRGVQQKAQDKETGDIRARALAEAKANAAAARAQIGEDVLDRIAAAMTKKQQSAMERAKRDIAGADVDKVLDELKFMLDEGRH